MSLYNPFVAHIFYNFKYLRQVLVKIPVLLLELGDFFRSVCTLQGVCQIGDGLGLILVIST